MTNRTVPGFLPLALAAALSACDSGAAPGPKTSGPTAPSPPAPPSAPIFVIEDVTVSGVVYEVTPTGEVPIEGVGISNGEGPSRMVPQLTDENGYFSFRSVWVCPCAGNPGNGPVPAGMTFLIIRKSGYEDPLGLPESVFRPHDTGYRDVMIVGDTHVRMQLVKR
jgi:hypothetical protein